MSLETGIDEKVIAESENKAEHQKMFSIPNPKKDEKSVTFPDISTQEIEANSQATMQKLAYGESSNTEQAKIDHREDSLKAIEQLAKKLGVEQEKLETIDLTKLTNEEITLFFYVLAQSGRVVLHGSNSELPYAELQARQANDASKESGNLKAVYATSEPYVGLMRAVINKGYLAEKCGTYAFGESLTNGRKTFKATPNVYDRFAAHDPQVVADGYMYVLDKSEFTQDTQTEYHALENQTPIAVCKIPKRLGEKLFTIGDNPETDTVLPYTKEEQEALETHTTSLAENVVSFAFQELGTEKTTGGILAEKLSTHPMFQQKDNPAVSKLLEQIAGLPELDKGNFIKEIVRNANGLE